MTTAKNANASASASSPEDVATGEAAADRQPPVDRFDGMTDDEIVALLEEEIARLTIEREQTISLEKELRTKEDFANGICFATEIFEAQQNKLRLGVEIELRQKKSNRIRRGFAEGVGPVSNGVKSGFLF